MQLNGQVLTLAEIASVALGDEAVQISAAARPRILASRKVIENIIARDELVYGVSTGFGKLSDVRIPRDALGKLQLNPKQAEGINVAVSILFAVTPAELAIRFRSLRCAR